MIREIVRTAAELTALGLFIGFVFVVGVGVS